MEYGKSKQSYDGNAQSAKSGHKNNFFRLKSDAGPEKFLKQNFVIHDLLFS
jgi:hypothetical protein